MVTKFTQLGSYNELLLMCNINGIIFGHHTEHMLTRCNPHLLQRTCILIAAHHFLLLSPLLNCISLEDILVYQISWFCCLLTLSTCSYHVLNGSVYHSTDKLLMSRLKTAFSTRHRATTRWEECFLGPVSQKMREMAHPAPREQKVEGKDGAWGLPVWLWSLHPISQYKYSY